MSDVDQITKPAVDFDPDALREKYRQERDKRLRADGENQYVQMSGPLAQFLERDPHVEPGFVREPLTDEVDVVVIGGGFGGLLAATRLREAGVNDIRIIEAAGDFGGTWYWNRYPGAQCDIDSYCYLPLLEELNYVPKERYSYAEEILEHAQRVGRAFNLYDAALFQTRVRDLRWAEDTKRWTVHTNRNDAIKARFVIVAMGTTSQPKLPGVTGIEEFEGHAFHTSRWDYDYTGGDAKGNLQKLADKRVAVIGTGASAIQTVPFLGRDAKHLYVFQRTPSSVGLRGNKPTDPVWASSLQPGWQRQRRENFNDIAMGVRVETDLVSDSWTEMFRNNTGISSETTSPAQMSPEEMFRNIELADFKRMNEIRARVDAVVKDPAVADLLKPWYLQLCKRPTFNDDYLPTFNRPNVTLVDTSETKGVERITKKGVVANGIEYEVDCIIFASGFETSSEFKRRLGFEIYGRDGLSLFDYWAKGSRTLHGYGTHGFPNWFFMGLSQNGLSVNMTAMLDDQARHVAYIISEVKARGALAVEPSIEAQDEWVETIHKLSAGRAAVMATCTPGVYNNEGGERAGSLIVESYTPGLNAFNELLAEWRAKGDLSGLIVHRDMHCADPFALSSQDRRVG